MRLGFWERRKARKAFEKFVSPDVMRLIEKSPSEFLREPELRHFQFVVIVPNDSRAEDIAANLSRVADACLRHRSMISNISASLVVACLGVPFPDADSVEARLTLVNALVAENGDRIRVAHGQCNGVVGNLGSKQRFCYEAVIPGFSEILKQLLNSPNGTVVEVASNP